MRSGPHSFVGRVEKAIVSVNDALAFVARLVLGVILLAATFVVCANVGLRYLLNSGLTWSEEVTKYALIWIVFIGSGVLARRVGHISIGVLKSLMPARVDRPYSAVIQLLSGVVVLFIGVVGWRVTIAVWQTGQTGVAAEIPVFLVYAAIPIGCFMMCLGFCEAALRARQGHIEEGPETADDGSVFRRAE